MLSPMKTTRSSGRRTESLAPNACERTAERNKSGASLRSNMPHLRADSFPAQDPVADSVSIQLPRRILHALEGVRLGRRFVGLRGPFVSTPRGIRRRAGRAPSMWVSPRRGRAWRASGPDADLSSSTARGKTTLFRHAGQLHPADGIGSAGLVGQPAFAAKIKSPQHQLRIFRC